ncbi:MAG: D-alanyl-D-alanine carboxypeptidase [Oscillospiraceae bacterium]|nr:D-alanyl-D-alanine carboxypeptidase [Oscillospiraceae bacterium]MBP3520783.1 D-alanyl-D-alanine carboxypeptidase [Oscillospiraceae bacterium]
MKKYHSLSAFFLVLTLLFSLTVPAWADESGEDFTITAESAILVEAGTGEVLFEKDPDARRYPASITKVMTGLLVVEAIERGDLAMDDVITLGSDIYTGIGVSGSTAGLQEGEMLTVRDLLNAALIPSANEACNALATAVAGSISAFVDRMNERAAELGMTNTHFVNPHGYHDDDHYTTARDISVMCVEAMSHTDFREIVSSGTYTIPPTNLHDRERVLKDTNALVDDSKISGYRYQYAIGIKTGFTTPAGYCLASAAEKNHRMLIGVLLGGKYWISSDNTVIQDNYFTESRRLLEYGFNNFSSKTVLDTIEPIGTVPVTLCKEQDYITVLPAQSITATLPNDLDPALFQRDVTLPDSLQAPIEKGQVLGTISISYEGRDFGTVDLVATTSLERSQFLYVLDRIAWALSFLWVKLLLLVVVLLILLLVLRRAIFGPSRKKRRRNQSYSHSYTGRRR